jgi:hypothetical protein
MESTDPTFETYAIFIVHNRIKDIGADRINGAGMKVCGIVPKV